MPKHQREEGPKWECIHCHSVMDRTNFKDFIKQSDNDKNSNQQARVLYHTWQAVPEDVIDERIVPEL